MTQAHFSFDSVPTTGTGRVANPASAASGNAAGRTSPNEQSGAESTGGDDLVEDVVQGADVAVMPDGALAVAFLDTTFDGAHRGLAMIIVAFSDDGGSSFREPVQAGIFREIGQTPRTANFRFWSASFPQLAAGPEGEVYITVTAIPGDRPTDDGDVLLLRSNDQGQTWEPPLRLNSDDTDRLQFFPTIGVDADGVVHAMWGDMRNDPHEVRYDIYYSESLDQGSSWHVQDELGDESPEVRATDYASSSLVGFAGGRFLGDHFSLIANASNVYLAWTDTRLGDLGAPNQQIGFARSQPLRSPMLRVSPSAGTSGSELALQGAGFQPVTPIAVGIGGVTLTTVISDEQGNFESPANLPMTEAGLRQIRAVDDTGNFATVDFTVVTGSDSAAQN